MDPFSIHKDDRLLNQQLGIDYKRDKKIKGKAGRKPKEKNKIKTDDNKH